jgi:hypothetical protein
MTERTQQPPPPPHDADPDGNLSGTTRPVTNETREERQAAAELKKLEEQKRLEGPSMGLEGSRLVTEKRRRGFLDDEDFEDVIDDTEPEL